MASPLTPTPSSESINDLEYQKFRADGSSGFSVAVVNPDGSNVSGGGGGGGTQYVELATTSPATGNLVLGRYQTSLPILTNGQMNEPMLDSSSRLIVSPTTNQSVNNTQINGTTVSVSNGTTDAGTQRVTLSSDSTGQIKLAASSATNIGNVGSISATGSAVPANAFYLAGINASGNLAGLVTYDRANDGASGTGIVSVGNYLYNGTNDDRIRSVINGTNSTGTGIVASGLVGQFDDVSPTAITENQFGNVRMSANRNVYGTIRDAAGNERGANVTASNELVVSDSGLRPAGTALNTYSVHLTTNTTTTPTASTAYISSIVISVDATATTLGTLTVKDKSGTPLTLINGLNTTSAITTVPTVVNFQTPIKMVGGIDIITAATAGQATLDVWLDYYQ